MSRILIYFSAEILTAQNNEDLLIEQALKFNPNIVVIGDDKKYLKVKEALANTDVKVFGGEDSLTEAAAIDCYDMMIAAIVGFAGIKTYTTRPLKVAKLLVLRTRKPLLLPATS